MQIRNGVSARALGGEFASPPMRLYFHLANEDCQIPDHSGLEVDGATDVRAQALKALEEISSENPQLFEHGKGWRVNVADGSGKVLFSLALDDGAEGLRPT